MIYITNFIHRGQLYDIIRRWLLDQPLPGDVRCIAELVNFNLVYTERYLRSFREALIGDFFGWPLRTQRALTKGAVKDVLIHHPPYRNEEISSLIRTYHAYPEHYYRETPFNGVLIFSGSGPDERYRGCTRIKRVRRLAEKSARRIIDFLYTEIRQGAEKHAARRATDAGMPIEQLISDQEAMGLDFARSEEEIIVDLLHGDLFRKEEEFIIQDVAGIKLIVESDDYPRLLEHIEKDPHNRIVEVEEHRGNYTATNLIIRYRPDKERLIDKPLGRSVLQRFEILGMGQAAVERAFREFVLGGEENVNIEVIVSDYQKMLESEIGDAMHEERIIRQRRRQRYRGSLPKNVEYLMEYLFALAIAPTNEVPEVPIKLKNRYLPDYFDKVIKNLFAIPQHWELE